MKKLEENQIPILVGKRIRFLRKERKLTQKKLAKLVGMEETAVQRIETARTNPTVKTLAKIATGLDVELKELFEG